MYSPDFTFAELSILNSKRNIKTGFDYLQLCLCITSEQRDDHKKCIVMKLPI